MGHSRLSTHKSRLGGYVTQNLNSVTKEVENMKSNCRIYQIVGIAMLVCLACRPINTVQDHNTDKHLKTTSEVLYGKVVYYVAPNGNDTSSGNLRRPFRTLEKAFGFVKPGDTVYVRGGTYYCEKTILFDKSGEEDNPIRVWAYQGERPVFDFSGAWDVGFLIKGAYWHLKGLSVTRTQWRAVCLRSTNAHHNTIENITAYENDLTGISIQSGAANNLVLNCDSHHNFDPASNGQNADGFEASFTIGSGNVFRGCRAWNNADDGFDFDLSNNSLRVEMCYAWQNGQNIWNHPLWEGNANGFKFGGGNGAPILSNCVAWAHAYHGFKTSMQGAVYNCTAFHNLAGYSAHMNKKNADQNVKNNISWPGSSPIESQHYGEHNSWNKATGVKLTLDDFLSTDDSIITGPRNPDGSLPVNDFLKLAPGSDVIDAGIDVGLPYIGSAPDLGAFEYVSQDGLSRSSVRRRNAEEHEAKDTQMDPILREAVENGELNTVKKLIVEAGTEHKILTALLYIAIAKGDLDTVRYLVSKGADVNGDAPTPVPYGLQRELCDRLRLGETPENKYHWTPLHAAVNGRYAKIVRYLIAKKAFVNTKDDLECTPLHVAAWQFPNVIPLLIDHGADVHAKDVQGRTALHHAAERNRLKGIKSLITAGANVNAADNYGSRPLHCAACYGHRDAVELLIANDAEVNSIDNVGRPPLYYAARWGRGSVAALLISKGANPNIADKWGWTPVHIASLYVQEEAMKGLLTEKTDVSLKNNRGRTALSIALWRGHELYEILCSNPAYIGKLRQEKAIVDLLLKHGARVEVGQKECPVKSLQQAAAEGDIIYVKNLLSRGTDINNQDDINLYTGLHVAAQAEDVDMTKLLLTNGANTKLVDRFNCTALHYAVSKGNRKITELLISEDADVNSRNDDGQMPIDIAFKDNRKDIVELLLANGAEASS